MKMVAIGKYYLIGMQTLSHSVIKIRFSKLIDLHNSLHTGLLNPM